jgi:hypothetical protein
MTEAEAITKLAELVAEIARRSWDALGTGRSLAIQSECSAIIRGTKDEDNLWVLRTKPNA